MNLNFNLKNIYLNRNLVNMIHCPDNLEIKSVAETEMEMKEIFELNCGQ